MQVRTLEHLTGDQYDAGVAELARLVGDDAHRPEWFRRLVMSTDGTWLLSYREARSTLARDAFDAPDRWVGGDLAYDTKLAPIADAVAILRKEHSADREVARRQERWREHQAAQEQRRKAEAAVQVEQTRRQQDHAARRPERWKALTPLQRALYTLAERFTQSESRPLSNRETFVQLAVLVGKNLEDATPARTFEPQHAENAW